jgi:hypothetical protein
MSALGQKQTFAAHRPMSALPPIATSIALFGMSNFGPKADIDGLRGPLTDRFSLRQDLWRIPSIC